MKSNHRDLIVDELKLTEYAIKVKDFCLTNGIQ